MTDTIAASTATSEGYKDVPPLCSTTFDTDQLLSETQSHDHDINGKITIAISNYKLSVT